MHFAKLSMVSVNEEKKCLVKLGKDRGEKARKKGLDILRQVSKHTSPFIFRYFAIYVDILFWGHLEQIYFHIHIPLGSPVSTAHEEGILKTEWLYKMTIPTREACKQELERIISYTFYPENDLFFADNC